MAEKRFDLFNNSTSEGEQFDLEEKKSADYVRTMKIEDQPKERGKKTFPKGQLDERVIYRMLPV